ncbi:lipopolysaccharide biosynthesis protein [Blautia sp.]|uniref:lipopolysaccharide biosynthesis protein n=1 Tax=Blautia sp. TaxID=1955243 RepID=UPI002E79FD65|nr:hypothetical protein [Blautia sp.]
MRSRQAFKNMAANLMLQVIVLLSGIILPRFFLEAYGSSVNGMITSINQFLTYLGLAEAGVGTASIVALYAPLANDDRAEVNAVLSATRKYYNRSGVIFLAMVVVLIIVYPFFISGQLDPSMVRGMVIVLASSTLVDYFFLGKYRVLLTANQEGYVVALVQAVGTIINTVVAIFLIWKGTNVVFVKTVATAVYMLRLLLIRAYVKRKYPCVDYHTESNDTALSQKGAALLHQIVGIIVNNTDVVMLTICLGSRSLLEVSVYGVYNLVVYAVNMLLTSFSNSLSAGFGEVISKGEKEILKESYSSYEYMYYMIFFIVISCMGVLLLPFISVYTMSMTDVDYIRPFIAILFTVIVFLQNIRIPGSTIICAAGHFRETRNQAILEAVINIGVSVILVWSFGMAGVLIGTVCSYGYRSLEIIVYNAKYLVKGSSRKTMSRLVRNIIVTILAVALGLNFVPQIMTSFGLWFEYAVITGCSFSVIFVIVNLVTEPKEFQALITRVIQVIKK